MTPPAELCSLSSPIPPPLAGPDLFMWMALRRVHLGRVAQLDGRYYDSGRRVPGYLPDVFDELIKIGLLTLAEPDPGSAGLCRAALTEAGRTRFTALNDRKDQWTRRPIRAGDEPAATTEIRVPTSRFSWAEPGETHHEQNE